MPGRRQQRLLPDAAPIENAREPVLDGQIRQVGLGNHGLLEVVEADERHVGAKAVSASFFPLDILGGLTSPGLLGEARGRVVYVAHDSSCRRSGGGTRFNQWRAVLVPRT